MDFVYRAANVHRGPQSGLLVAIGAVLAGLAGCCEEPVEIAERSDGAVEAAAEAASRSLYEMALVGMTRRTFVDCFHEQRLADPSLRMQLAVVADLNEAGEVVSSVVEPGTGVNDGVKRCLHAAARRLPMSGSGQPARVRLKFEIVPGRDMGDSPAVDAGSRK